jgi:rhodanese-related sulfurtransferase
LNMKKPAICIVLVALLASTFLLIQPTIAEVPGYQTISVQHAKHMINNTPNLLILDVRNESEYTLGHLYNAVLIPLNELDSRISEIATSQNDKVLVYCKAGSRSAPACQILADHGFTKVYNMEGGITSWMQAGYKIDTSYHYVSIDPVNPVKEDRIDIEPFLLFQADCPVCNQGCTNSSTPIITNSSITVLDDGPTHQMLLVSYLDNDTLVQMTVEKNLLWSYNQTETDLNRTITLISTVISNENTSRQIYGLADFVQTSEYNMTLVTGLDPLDSNTYNASLTTISYVPVGKNESLSGERIQFNSSATLSEQYQLLSQVSKKLANQYSRSPDETLHVFADRYQTIASEFTLLSHIVKTNLPNYNHEILRGTAAITDDATSCILCQIGLNALIGGGCIAICILTLTLACGICLDYGWAISLILGMGVEPFCESIGYCP